MECVHTTPDVLAANQPLEMLQYKKHEDPQELRDRGIDRGRGCLKNNIITERGRRVVEHSASSPPSTIFSSPVSRRIVKKTKSVTQIINIFGGDSTHISEGQSVTKYKKLEENHHNTN